MPPERRPNTIPDSRVLLRAVERFASAKVLVVGDVMLDHYMQGEVERISPEAPVPVLQVGEEWRLLGGAGNVARNIAAMGAKVDLVCAIGNDVAGTMVQSLLAESGVTGHVLVENRRTTTVKTRIIARNQQLVRVDRENAKPLEPSTEQAFVQLLQRLMPDHDVVVVSDYGKGVITPQLMRAIRSMRRPDGTRPMVLVDPKVVHADLYAEAYLLTPNAKEASEMSGLPTGGRDEVIRAGLALFKKLRCEKLCITLGAQGMAIFEQPQRVLRLPTMARTVFDVTGAGDTVMAVLALGMAAGLDVVQAGAVANLAASFVVGQVGTGVVTAEEICGALQSRPLPEGEVWLDL